jgi:hypothetical protein
VTVDFFIYISSTLNRTTETHKNKTVLEIDGFFRLYPTSDILKNT